MYILKRYAAYIYLATAVFSLFTGLFILFYKFDIYNKTMAMLDKDSERIPILLYHHLADGGDNPGAVISAEMFESHIKALRDGGYTAISFDELCGFVYDGTPLPTRPVVITFDDGYTSNYEIAYPILKKYGMKATVFIIGVMHGAFYYRDTKIPIYIPHFGDAEAVDMARSGIISIQSHSYDMHQDSSIEPGPFRFGVLRMSGESLDDYIEAFNKDFEESAAQIESISGERPFVYSYPFGECNKLTEKLLLEDGVKVTLTTKKGSNIVTRGSPKSLFGLRRYNVFGNMTADRLLSMIG